MHFTVWTERYSNIMIFKKFWILKLATCFCIITPVASDERMGKENIFCRDSWFPNITFDGFSKLTCSKCYVQVFFDRKELTISFPPIYPFPLVNRSGNESYISTEDQLEICQKTLTMEECLQWTACCSAARQCCYQSQQESLSTAGGEALCPSTWDGVSCWPATSGGSSVDQTCPYYYMPRDVHWLSPEAHKVCNESGDWAVHPVFGTEMSDYNKCFDTSTNSKIIKAALCIDIVGNVISIILLLISIIIITASRNLRIELLGRDSVRIHFNLFFAMLILGVCNIILDALLLDGLKNPNESIFDQSNCDMFCEGLYLHKRISNVMKVGIRDSLIKYYIIGWALPAIWVGTYAIVRFVAFNINESCLAEGEFYYFELIHIVPNLLSLASNLVFLVSIEFMLCTKLRSDTTDRRMAVLRHALRATLSLIPIFGIQFLFIIYRPYWPPYEIVAAFFTSTQGALVAILYCFTNKEVKEEVHDWFYQIKMPNRQKRGNSIASTATKASHLSAPRPSVDITNKRASKNLLVKLKNKQAGLPDVITTNQTNLHPSNRRESNWSQLTTHTVLNGSTLGGSGRSLDLSSIASNSNSSKSSLNTMNYTPPTSRHQRRSRSLSNPTDTSSFQKVDQPNRPHTLCFEMIEMSEPLMDQRTVETVVEDATSLTDIEEEKMQTSPLTPIVEVDV